MGVRMEGALSFYYHLCYLCNIVVVEAIIPPEMKWKNSNYLVATYYYVEFILSYHYLLIS